MFPSLDHSMLRIPAFALIVAARNSFVLSTLRSTAAVNSSSSKDGSARGSWAPSSVSNDAPLPFRMGVGLSAPSAICVGGAASGSSLAQRHCFERDQRELGAAPSRTQTARPFDRSNTHRTHHTPEAALLQHSSCATDSALDTAPGRTNFTTPVHVTPGGAAACSRTPRRHTCTKNQHLLLTSTHADLKTPPTPPTPPSDHAVVSLVEQPNQNRKTVRPAYPRRPPARRHAR